MTVFRTMRRVGLPLLAAAWVCGFTVPQGVAGAATPEAESLDAALAQSDRIKTFYQGIVDSFVEPKWLSGRDQLIYWDEIGELHGSWVIVDAKTGRKRSLVSPDRLAKAVGVDKGNLHNLSFDLSRDQSALLFTRGKSYYAVNLKTGDIRTLDAASPEAWPLLRNGEASPNGKAMILLRDGGFQVMDAAGTAREEKGVADYGWEAVPKAWSPDSRFVVVQRTDNRGVHHIPVVDYLEALETVEQVPYTKTGTPLTRTQFYSVSSDGNPVEVDIPAGDDYRWFAGWRPDGHEGFVLRLSRDAKQLDLLAFDPATGRTRTVLREENRATFVAGLDFAVGGWMQQVVPLDQGFLWASERDGWRHYYAYGYDGVLKTQVTRGAFPVHDVFGVSERDGLAFVTASPDPDEPYRKALFSVPLGGGPLKALTPEPTQHRGILSPSGRYLVDSHSNFTTPRVRDLVTIATGARTRLTAADVTGLAALKRRPPERVTALAADGTTRLYGVIFTPADFDPNKRYPVVDIIYAGPFTTIVPQTYIGTAEGAYAESLAAMGFVTVVVDPRGTPGRGKAFQDANYGRLGQTEIPDHAAVLRELAATRPYMDMDRVGIWGHSWGGYFALRGMLTAPDLFKAGYAGAPGAFSEEAIINEPYMNLRELNPDGYAAGSNEALAGNLVGHLKIMHGTSDVNASFSTTMRMSEALILANKPFETLIMPGQPHSPQDPYEKYYWDDVRRFFLTHLGTPE